MRFLSSLWFFLFVQFDENVIVCDIVWHQLWRNLDTVTWYLPCYARWVRQLFSWNVINMMKNEILAKLASRNRDIKKSISNSLRVYFWSQCILGHQGRLERSKWQCECIIEIINTIVFRQPYVGMRERVAALHVYRYYSSMPIFMIYFVIFKYSDSS